MLAGVLFGTMTAMAQSFWDELDSRPLANTVNISLAIDRNTDDIYVGTTRGIFRSDDDGATWEPVLLGDTAITALKAGADGVIYAGGRGLIYRSADAGATWSRHPLGMDVPVWEIEVTPTGTVLAGTGDIYDQGEIGYYDGDGIYRSTDGGITWNRSVAGITGPLYIGALTVAPNGLVYAGTADAYRTDGAGLFVSDDDGRSWRKLPIEIDGHNVIQDHITVERIDDIAIMADGRIFVGIQGASGTVHVQFNAISADGGGTWTPVQISRYQQKFWMQPSLYTAYVASDGTMMGAIYRGSQGLHRSTDGGATWTREVSGLYITSVGFNRFQFDEDSRGRIYAVQFDDYHVYRTAREQPSGVEARPQEHLLAADVFPNPATSISHLSLLLPAAADLSVEVVDMLGRDVAALGRGRYDAGRHSFTWDAGGSTAGLYFYKVRCNGRMMMNRIVVHR